MIRSMTGFARRERQYPWGLLAWEVKTVNHRYLEIGLRLAEEFRAAESDFRQAVAAAVRRGKLDCSLHFRPAAGGGALEVDAPLLAALTARARETALAAGPAGRIDVIEMLRWPGVARSEVRDAGELHAAARQLLGEALEQRCAGLDELAARVAARLPEVRTRIAAKLRERVAQLVSEVNHDRLEQELAILAQRLDVDEEIDRLRGHLTEVRKAFGGTEPAGRRRDFLMQELNREANTLSSKSQDLETTRAAVDMKVLIEQMREQVQNIE